MADQNQNQTGAISANIGAEISNVNLVAPNQSQQIDQSNLQQSNSNQTDSNLPSSVSIPSSSIPSPQVIQLQPHDTVASDLMTQQNKLQGNTIPNLISTNELSTNPSPNFQPLLSLEPDQLTTKGISTQSTISNNVPTVTNKQDQEQKSQQQLSPQKTVVTKVKLHDELNIFDWLRTTDIINQIAEKAKNSVDSVITTLDPGMKEYLYSGGNINIIVISDYVDFVSPIRDTFQSVFGRATVTAAKHSSTNVTDSFPIKLAYGFNEAIRVAQERIRLLRLNTSDVPQNQVVIAVQPAIVHVIDAGLFEKQALHESKLDENIFASCYLTYCLVLEDPVLGFTLNSYSQFIPLDQETLVTLNQNKTPENSDHYRLGFTVSIDDIMNSKMKLLQDEGSNSSRWLQDWAGFDICQVVRNLSSSLAHMYRRKWTECVS